MRILSRLIDAWFASRHTCSECGRDLPDDVVGADATCSDECADAYTLRMSY